MTMVTDGKLIWNCNIIFDNLYYITSARGYLWRYGFSFTFAISSGNCSLTSAGDKPSDSPGFNWLRTDCCLTGIPALIKGIAVSSDFFCVDVQTWFAYINANYIKRKTIIKLTAKGRSSSAVLLAFFWSW